MSITYTLNHGSAADNVTVYEPPSGKQWKSAKTPAFALVVGTPVSDTSSECVIPLGGYWTDSTDSSTGSDLVFSISNVSPIYVDLTAGLYIDRTCHLHIPRAYLAKLTANSAVGLFTLSCTSTAHPSDSSKPVYISTNSSAYSTFIENASA